MPATPAFTTPVHLADRAVLAIGGADAAGFLHNLVSANVETLADGAAAHALLLTPQGKILFEFFVVRHGEGFLVDVDAASAEALRKRLAIYKLRAEVTLAPREDLAVVAVPEGTDPPHPAAIVFADPRRAEIGRRAFVARDAMPRTGDEAAYEGRRIGLALPAFGADYRAGDVVPHDVNFDQFATIDFRKGCYIGQEIVSRMKHRNTARKRLVRVRPVTAGHVLPPPGTVIKADFREIGAMGSSLDGDGLAIVRLDWAKDARDQGIAVTAEGIALDLTLPDYAQFDWPADGAH